MYVGHISPATSGVIASVIISQL